VCIVSNCITVGSNSVHFVWTANSCSSPSCTRSRISASCKSSFEYTRAFPMRFHISFTNGRGYQFYFVLGLISRKLVQKHNFSSCFFVNDIGVANGDDYCQMTLFDIFSFRDTFNTTNLALDIEYNGPHVQTIILCYV
jgi:hypothetical protein